MGWEAERAADAYWAATPAERAAGDRELEEYEADQDSPFSDGDYSDQDPSPLRERYARRGTPTRKGSGPMRPNDHIDQAGDTGSRFSDTVRGALPATMRFVKTNQLLDAIASGNFGDMFGQDKQTRFPVEPPDGSVLRWYKTFPNSDSEYSYVATRTGDKWYHTATRGLPVNPITWDQVESDIGNWPCELARTWGQIPQVPAGRFDGADPDDWFREMYENTVTVEDGKES